MGSEMCIRDRPNPYPLIQICKKLQIKEEKSIMVGDSVTDLKAGHNAGMPVALVNYGYTDDKSIYDQADIVIDNFNKLKELI